MEIINLSTDKGQLINTVFDYGVIQRYADTNIKILLKSNEILQHKEISADCGCTGTEAEKTDEGILLKIKYNSNLLGSFTKGITETYIIGGQKKSLRITIKGTVKNG